MKALNKIAAVAAAAVLGTIGLVGCSDSGSKKASDCAGSWVVDSMESGEESLTSEQLEELAEAGMDVAGTFALDMEADGTARISIEGEEASGTWEATDGGCAITIDGTTNVAPLKDGKLTLGDDEVTVVFKRG